MAAATTEAAAGVREAPRWRKPLLKRAVAALEAGGVDASDARADVHIEHTSAFVAGNGALRGGRGTIPQTVI